MVGAAELAKPGPPRGSDRGHDAQHGIDEHHAALRPDGRALEHQQAADLVIRVGNDERRSVEPIALSQSRRQALEQRIERVGLEQLHLARLRAAPCLVVLPSLLRQSRQAAPEILDLALVVVPVHSASPSLLLYSVLEIPAARRHQLHESRLVTALHELLDTFGCGAQCLQRSRPIIVQRLDVEVQIRIVASRPRSRPCSCASNVVLDIRCNRGTSSPLAASAVKNARFRACDKPKNVRHEAVVIVDAHLDLLGHRRSEQTRAPRAWLRARRRRRTRRAGPTAGACRGRTSDGSTSPCNQPPPAARARRAAGSSASRCRRRRHAAA